MKKSMGFWWPNGGEEYGRRYIQHAEDMNTALAFVPKHTRRVAIQAGGHVGVWAKWLSSRFENVVTVEPEADNWTALQANLVGYSNVVRYNAALGDAERSVGVKFNQKNIGGHKIVGEGLVPMVTIDSLNLKAVDLVVLDIEGWEHPAIVGGSDTIARCRPVIMVENRDHGDKVGQLGFPHIVQLLGSWGYREAARISHDVVFAPC